MEIIQDLSELCSVYVYTLPLYNYMYIFYTIVVMYPAIVLLHVYILYHRCYVPCHCITTCIYFIPSLLCTVKPVLSGHSKIDKTIILLTNGNLMKV